MGVTRVVMAGAGFAGLAGALFLARRGHEVTVIERDGAPPDGEPSDDVDRWRHPGVPQARQSHALLARAARVLADEAPDVIAAFVERGIRAAGVKRFGFVIYYRTNRKRVEIIAVVHGSRSSKVWKRRR